VYTTNYVFLLLFWRRIIIPLPFPSFSSLLYFETVEVDIARNEMRHISLATYGVISTFSPGSLVQAAIA
jgi:hypothetical protein